jgi:hypothetical protein
VGTSFVALSADFRKASATSRTDGAGRGAEVEVGVVVSDVVVGVGVPAARASSSTRAVA